MATVRYTDFSSYDDSEAVRRFTNHLRDEIAAMSRVLVEYATFRQDLIFDLIEEKEMGKDKKRPGTDESVPRRSDLDAEPGTTEFLRQVERQREDDEEHRREAIRESVGEYVFTVPEISDSLGWSQDETRGVLSTMVEEGAVERHNDAYTAVPNPDRETGYDRFEYIVSDNCEIYPVGKRGDGNGCSPFSLIDNPTVVDTTDYVSHVERSEFDDVSLEVSVPDSLKDSVVENLRLRRVLDGTNLTEYAQIYETTGENFSREDVERMGWSEDRVSEVLGSVSEESFVDADHDGYVWVSEPEVVVDGVSEEDTRDWFDSNSPDDCDPEDATKWLGWRY
ncbi:MAG: hypothetical protein SV253_01775 [Halobacteria archaeon]|nr:hypothetical protein [Halobacteria archaeon]